MKNSAKQKEAADDGGVSLKVDKTIKEQVQEFCNENGMKIGKFYDLAAKERLDRLISEKKSLFVSR